MSAPAFRSVVSRVIRANGPAVISRDMIGLGVFLLLVLVGFSLANNLETRATSWFVRRRIKRGDTVSETHDA